MDDWIHGFISGFVVTFVIAVIIAIESYGGGYKSGQIDAITGNVYYCLDNRFEWQYNVNPVDELKCEAE